MVAYWKLPCEPLEFPEDSDIERYVKERWPSEAEYAKARLYGQVATCEIGCVADSHEFVLPENRSTSCDALSFLYGVRVLHEDARNELTFPPRYRQMESPPSWKRTKKEEQDIVDAIVSGFNGEHPKLLPEVLLLTEPHHGCELRDADLSLLSEVECVSIQNRPFDEDSVEWIVKLVNWASNLQVIVLQSYNVTSDYFCLDLDDLCGQLAACRSFWSRFRMLKILPRLLEEDELWRDYGVSAPEEYTVSQASLDQLITAYFSAPTDHSQLVQFSFTNIKCQESAYHSPTVDRTYLQFKNIRFSDCRFTFKAIPDAISMWLGQDIEVREKEDQEEASSILFQIADNKNSSILGHKRKYCEVADGTDDQIN